VTPGRRWCGGYASRLLAEAEAIAKEDRVHARVVPLVMV
jgi:hypothetical protein